jgi:hydrogenase expression/formation protein HypD
VTLVHGPGCPVCVTPLELIDRAIAIARRPEVILTSFGDMLRVPGSGTDLLSVKASGGDVRMVYSPLDAVKLAQASRPAGGLLCGGFRDHRTGQCAGGLAGAAGSA